MTVYDRHTSAVARSLGWAEAAADAGDYGEALAWLAAVEAVAQGLPPEWEHRRAEWTLARRAGVRVTTDRHGHTPRSLSHQRSGTLQP